MDPRQLLIGTWVSDKRKTLKRWREYPLWPLGRRRRFAAMFGKLELRFTARRVHSLFEGTKSSKPYAVVASDAHSVTIRLREWDTSSDEEREVDVFRQLTFERSNGVDYYWCPVGSNAECFRKIAE